MKIIEIFGDDRYPQYTKLREECRGILIRDGKILLSYYKIVDQYLIPGGGLEIGESLKDCCAREMGEEVGAIVDPHTHYLTLEEYYHEYYFKSHYFICDYLGDCDLSHTQTEKINGLEPRWVEYDEALKIFASYDTYKETDKVKYAAYYREYLSLSEFEKTVTD